MKTLPFPPQCTDCAQDVTCEMCAESLCRQCALTIGGKCLCRACSSKVRHDYGLIDQFMQWHIDHAVAGVKITNGPMQRDLDDDKFGAHVEFETHDLIGFVSVFSNGQCDINVMSIANGRSVLNRFVICHNAEEMSELLRTVYKVLLEP